MRAIFIFVFSIFLLSCSSDDQMSKNNESKENLSMLYEGNLLDFKKIRQGKFTNQDKELIGFFIESELIIDGIHKNKFLMLFRTDFTSHIEFEGIEFAPFISNPMNPNTAFAYVYQHTLPEFNSPFTVNLRIENERVIGSFEGYIHRSNDPNDMKYMAPVYLSEGKIDIEIAKFLKEQNRN